MKISKAILTQKDQEYILRYWTEEKPEYDWYDPRSKTGTHESRYDFEKELETWEKSFKEVRIHPTQVEAFKELAFQYELNTVEKVRPKEGVSISPENVSFCNFWDHKLKMATPFAFLVEGIDKEAIKILNKEQVKQVGKNILGTVESSPVEGKEETPEEKINRVLHLEPVSELEALLTKFSVHLIEKGWIKDSAPQYFPIYIKKWLEKNEKTSL